MVRGALLIDLDQDRGMLHVLPVPPVKWSQQLQTIAGDTERERERERKNEGERHSSCVMLSVMIVYTHLLGSTSTEQELPSAGGSW